MFKLILTLLVLGCALAFQSKGNNLPATYKVPDIGVVYVLNADGKKINEKCLIELVKRVAGYCDENKLEPIRTKIWKDHTIVKEALSEETIKIERESGNNILIPVKYKGGRIILYKDDEKSSSYALYGLSENLQKVDFSACIN